MAAELNARCVRLGVSSNYLSLYTAEPDAQGSDGVSRCVVDWYETKSLGKVAESDLDSGKIKKIQIFDFTLFKWQEEADREGK